jgi:hypothetical protein
MPDARDGHGTINKQGLYRFSCSVDPTKENFKMTNEKKHHIMTIDLPTRPLKIKQITKRKKQTPVDCKSDVLDLGSGGGMERNGKEWKGEEERGKELTHIRLVAVEVGQL